MYLVSTRERQLLQALGSVIRRARIEHDLCQTSMAARIGISTPTYRRVEQGHAAVPIGYWIRALNLLGIEDDVQKLLGSIDIECGSVSAARFQRVRTKSRLSADKSC